MKKLGLIIVMFALILSAGVSYAAEDGNSSAPEMCKFFQDSAPETFDFFHDSLGDCINDLTEPQNDPAVLCQLDYFRAYYGYDSVGECVSTMRT